ncbi:MAG: S49 family peptidase, partial [Pseudomonadota bacterium]
CAALAEAIRRCRADKPVYSFVADHAYSAGYWIASQADRVIVSRTSGTGSIGVIWFHVDRSAAAAMDGFTVTPVFSGAHKADGHPYAPLPDAVRAAIEAELGAMRQIFAEDVAAGRGDRLDVGAVLATEAATYVGAEAVEAGLADDVADLRSAFRDFVAETDGRPLSLVPMADGGNHMATKPNEQKPAGAKGDDGKGQDAPEANQDGGTPPAPSKQKADAGPKPADAPSSDAGADAAASAKARIKAILTSDEAQGREDLAQAMAFDDAYAGLSAEAAIAALAKAPKGTATGTLGGLMADDDSDLGAGADAEAGRESIVAIQKARHGVAA